jgi:hypothetical protein
MSDAKTMIDEAAKTHANEHRKPEETHEEAQDRYRRDLFRIDPELERAYRSAEKVALIARSPLLAKAAGLVSDGLTGPVRDGAALRLEGIPTTNVRI